MNWLSLAVGGLAAWLIYDAVRAKRHGVRPPSGHAGYVHISPGTEQMHGHIEGQLEEAEWQLRREDNPDKALYELVSGFEDAALWGTDEQYTRARALLSESAKAFEQRMRAYREEREEE